MGQLSSMNLHIFIRSNLAKELTPGCWFTKHTFDLILVNLIFNEINACSWSAVYVRNGKVISHLAGKFKKLSLLAAWKVKNSGKFKGFPLISCNLIIVVLFFFFVFLFFKDSETPLTYQFHYKTGGGLYTVVSYGSADHVKTVLPQGQKDNFTFEFSVTIKDKLFAETTVQLPIFRVSLCSCYTWYLVLLCMWMKCDSQTRFERKTEVNSDLWA